MLEKMELKIYGVCYERVKTRVVVIKIMKAKRRTKRMLCNR